MKKLQLSIQYAFYLIVGFVLGALVSQYGLIQYSSHFNLIWIEQFSAALSEGVVYPRWQVDYFDGLGAPSFFFYPSVSFYLISFMKFLCPWLSSESLLFAGYGLIIGLSGITCSFAFKPLYGPRIASVCGFIYMLLPYHLLVDVFDRGALSEISIYIWLPLCASLLLRNGLLHQSPYRYPVFVLLYALIFLSHLPCSIIISGFFCVVQFMRYKNTKGMFIFFGCFICSVLIASLYIVPAMLLLDTITSSFWTDFIYYKSYPFFAEQGSGQFLNRLITLIYIAYIIIILMVTLQIKEQQNFRLTILVLMSGIVFLLSPLSIYVWELLPFMPYIQFPWRFFTVLDLVIILAFGAYLSSSDKSFSKEWIALFLCIGCVTLFNFTYMPERVRATESVRNIIEHKLEHTYTSSEFFPKNAVQPENVDFDTYFREFDSVDLIKKETDLFHFRVDLDQPVKTEFRQYFFPGWEASIREGDRNEQIELSRSYRGLLELNLPAGKYNLVIERAVMFQEKVAYGLSLLGLLILVILFFNAKRISSLDNSKAKMKHV